MKTNRTQIHATRISCLFAVLLVASAGLQAATRITSVTGTVTIYTDSGESRPAAVGDVLQPGESIVTSYHSEAVFQADGVDVLLQENGSVSEPDGDMPESISLNYGIITGEAPRSSRGMFSVYTPLGTPEIGAGRFMVNSIFNVERQEMVLQVGNMDGRVALRSRYAGAMEYGRYYTGAKNYNGAMTEDTAELPPQHTAIIRLPVEDPYFADRVDMARNFAPEVMEHPPSPVIAVVVPTLTPEDPSVQVASPSSPQ